MSDLIAEIEELNETLGRANRLVKQRDQRIAELAHVLRSIECEFENGSWQRKAIQQALKGEGDE